MHANIYIIHNIEVVIALIFLHTIIFAVDLSILFTSEFEFFISPKISKLLEICSSGNITNSSFFFYVFTCKNADWVFSDFYQIM